MDRILIRDLAARCTIGANPEERQEKQEVVVSIALSSDLRNAGRTDRLDDTLDYRVIKSRVLSLVESSQFHLIEGLAESLAQACLESPRVEEVQVTVDKPGAIRFARSVAVEIVRRRS